MKTICIYHGNCADGFGAAWVVRQWAQKVGVLHVDYHKGVYGEAPPDVTGANVLIVDFSYARETILEMAGKAETITIIDHHKTAMENLAHIGQEADEKGLCTINTAFSNENSGAMLAWMSLMSEYTPPPLLRHIEDRDLWKFELEHTREIQAALFAYPYDFEVWDQLMAAPVEVLWTQGEAIERKHFKDINELVLFGMRRFTIGGHEVPVVNLPYTMSSDAGHILGEQEKFAACYMDTSTHRVFSLRSAPDGMDVSEIAKQYGGGGHQHAAGFKVPLTQVVELGLL